MNRPLTPEELELAPAWATDYSVCESDIVPSCIVFYNDNIKQWVYHKNGMSWSPILTRNEDLNTLSALPTVVEFDIESVEWSDSDFNVEIDGECLTISINYHDEYHDVDNHAYAELNKQDAINLAKALGITTGDLK